MTLPTVSPLVVYHQSDLYIANKNSTGLECRFVYQLEPHLCLKDFAAEYHDGHEKK